MKIINVLERSIHIVHLFKLRTHIDTTCPSQRRSCHIIYTYYIFLLCPLPSLAHQSETIIPSLHFSGTSNFYVRLPLYSSRSRRVVLTRSKEDQQDDHPEHRICRLANLRKVHSPAFPFQPMSIRRGMPSTKIPLQLFLVTICNEL